MESSTKGKWVCPKHGDGVHVLNFTVGEEVHSYCFRCFLAVLNQFVSKAVFVPEKIVSDELLESVKQAQANLASE